MVPFHSAIHCGPNEKLCNQIPVESSHRDLVKFRDEFDVTYKAVQTRLAKMASEAVGIIKRRWDSMETKLPVETLSKLSRADGAAYNSHTWEHSSACLPETRVDILREIIVWADKCSGPCIYWLSGVAGTGKSTISRTLARNFDDAKQLGASFFFSRGQGDLSNARKLITTIAHQLAHVLPVLVPKICQAIVDHPDIGGRGLREQWKHLILQPLLDLNETSKRSPFVIVIDALDECENDDDVRLILHLLSEAKSVDTIRLRIFITSRPETPIRLGFKEIKGTHQDFVLHQVQETTIRHDIKIFLNYELAKITRNTSVYSKWPGEDKIDRLYQRANGLFIYAATACRFIADPDWDPNESLSMILEHDYVGQSQAISRDLDAIYTTILQHSIKPGARDRRRLTNEFCQVVGSIVVLYKTLPAEILARLLGLPLQTINARLRTLHSVLDISENRDSPIKLLHLSFRDFLLDPERCTDQNLRVSEKHTHHKLFACCLRVMEQQLKRDICNLGDPGIKIEAIMQQSVSRELQYSCQYWIHHLHASDTAVSENDKIHEFLKQHVLHWLEALSLSGNLSDGIRAIEVLHSIATVGNPQIWEYVRVLNPRRGKRILVQISSPP